jgi:hypothetical protein
MRVLIDHPLEMWVDETGPHPGRLLITSGEGPLLLSFDSSIERRRGQHEYTHRNLGNFADPSRQSREICSPVAGLEKRSSSDAFRQVRRFLGSREALGRPPIRGTGGGTDRLSALPRQRRPVQYRPGPPGTPCMNGRR